MKTLYFRLFSIMLVSDTSMRMRKINVKSMLAVW